MSFTTPLFILLFFPISILSVIIANALSKKGFLSGFLTKIRAVDLLIIAFCIVFYMWACFDNILFLFAFTVFVYLFGLIIEKGKLSNPLQNANKKSKLALAVCLSILVLCLVYYKYTGFLLGIINGLFGSAIKHNGILAPLGISFITFSAISYLCDIYYYKATATNFIDCALYLTFFPKVVSGPIVLWREFKPKIANRKISIQGVSGGINLLIVGFAKKVILADQFGAHLSLITPGRADAVTSWTAAILFMLQIYFDFSGYSDIAIGISRIFGFDFSPNFNFPYLSSSIGEFWRRWHISLGRWFKEYIYFPLGGSRVSKGRIIFNTAAVFLITGIWHGAAWNYIIWGLINGFFVIIERLLKDNKFYKKIPVFVKWLCAMMITLFSWQVFRFEDLRGFAKIVLGMFGITTGTVPYTWQYYCDKQIMTFILIGIILSTVPGLKGVQEFYKKRLKTKTGYFANMILLSLLFVLAMIYLVNSTHNPFIYFQY